MSKLANVGAANQEKLATGLERPFIISFKYQLERNYKLSDLQLKDIKELQSFLDRVASMTFQDVDRLYKRKSDKEDNFNGQDVVHYGYSDGCRIHGIIENGRFKIIRIDANHRFHQ